MDEEVIKLALRCFDGDAEKAEALLKLLGLYSESHVSMPQVFMILPEDTCDN